MTRRGFLASTAAAGGAALAPLLASSPALAAIRAGAQHEPADVAVDWFRRAMALVQTSPGFTPPVASRAFAYAGVTLYEAVVPGMKGYRSLGGLLDGFAPPATHRHRSDYDSVVAANAAMARVLRLLFPTAPAAEQEAINALEASWSERPGSRGVGRRSVERGHAVADAVFDWSRGDGGHEGYLRNFPAEYVAPSGPGLWRPTPPAFARPLQPFWGANRCFVLASPDGGHPGPPTAFSVDPSSTCFAEAREVYDTVLGLTDEQREIALFWSDDPGTTATPPGHSVSILTQVLGLEDASLQTAAIAYAKVGMAVADAFIACWKVKYEYNLLRPITYINDHIDAGFGPQMPLGTPPFPEYPSGHSVQLAASAAVLTDLFGSLVFTDHTHDARGLPARRFGSFGEAANEAAISRLYGGIHYRPAIDRGLGQGRAIGEAVNALPLHS